MSSPDAAPVTRSYGCTFGCGNPYDVVIVQVADGTTELLCIPCFIRMASDMVRAITEADNPEIQAALTALADDSQQTVPGPSGKQRGKNAPATSTDPDVMEAFDSVVTVDELPPEFR